MSRHGLMEGGFRTFLPLVVHVQGENESHTNFSNQNGLLNILKIKLKFCYSFLTCDLEYFELAQSKHSKFLC